MPLLSLIPSEESAIAVPHPAPGSKVLGGALVLALFGLVYAVSLTFEYIEGDDATSIAYHAMGRSTELQPPYSAYQSMMDTILRVFPADERVLRVGSMLITALAAPMVVILVGMLALAWAPQLVAIPRWAVIVLVPLLAPEFLYLGLVYTPALVAMACVMGAHLLLRQAIERSGIGGWQAYKNPRFALSVLLFAAGAACRWDILAYGAVIAADVWFAVGLSRPEGAERKERFRLAAVWGGLALLGWLVAVTLNGYESSVVLRAIRASGPVEQLPGLPVMLATFQVFMTPAIAVLGVIGFTILVIRKDALSLLVTLGLLLVARYILRGVPKWILIATPGIVICALIGFSAAWTYAACGWRRRVIQAALIVLLLTPWFVGVRAMDGVSAYGPGFEVQPFDRPLAGKSFAKVTFGPGVLIPTSEGPRPLGGHAWVLLGGRWRGVARQVAGERANAVREALARRVPLMWDHGEGFAVSSLLGMNFSTQDSWKRTIGSCMLVERRFISRDGKRQLKLMRYSKRESLFNPVDLQELEQLSGTDRTVIYGYTSTLRQLYEVAPKALERLGTNSAVLNIEELRLASSAVTGADSSRLSRGITGLN